MDNDEEKETRRKETGPEVDERMDGLARWGGGPSAAGCMVGFNFSWSGILLKGNSKITAHYWPYSDRDPGFTFLPESALPP